MHHVHTYYFLSAKILRKDPIKAYKKLKYIWWLNDNNNNRLSGQSDPLWIVQEI